MAKKTLTSDIPDFGSDLDFDFGGDISGELNQEVQNPKSRSVVNNALRGAAGAVKDTVVSPSFVKETMKKVLPSTYGEVTEGVAEVAGGAYELYDETVRELKPKLGRITKKIDQLIPESNKTLKGIVGKVMDLTGESNTTYAATENQDDQAVTQMLGALFEQNKQYTKNDNAKAILTETIDKKRYARSDNHLGSIAKDVSIQTQYTVNTTQRYQRKMLELQLRGFLAQKEFYGKMNEFNTIFKTQNEAVVKNTSLPEFVKITNSERFMEVSKNRFYNSLYGEGSMMKRGMDKIKESGKQFIQGLGRSLDNVDMQLDGAISGKESIEQMNEMLASMGEPPLSKAELAGATAGANAIEWLRDTLLERFNVRETLGKNKGVTEGLSKAAKMFMNPAGTVDSIRKSESWQNGVNDYDSKKGMLYRFGDFIMSQFSDETPDRKFKAGQALDELNQPTMGFDNKAHLSLTDVIPGHLAAIHREIAMMRTGSDDVPLQTFDFTKREFVTKKEMSRRVSESLVKDVQRSSHKYYTEKAASSVAGDTELSEEDSLELKLFMGRLAHINDIDLTPENIRKTRAYDFLSDNVKDVVDRKLNEMDESEDKEFKSYEFTKNVKNIRNNAPSASKTFDNYVKSGHGDLIVEQGLATKDDDGNFVANEKAWQGFLEEHGIIKSDINVKEAIKEMKPEELLKTVKERFDSFGQSASKKLKGAKDKVKDRTKNWNPRSAYEGIKKTKLYDWFYQKGKGDDEPHSGPMAQEVNKNLGNDVAPGGKSIDLQSMNGALMAAIKHLGTSVEQLGKGGRSIKNEGILFKIRQDTAGILKLLQTQSKQSKGRGRSSRHYEGGATDAKKNDGYGDLIGSTTGNIIELAKKVSGDVFGAASRVFTTGKDKVAKPILSFVSEQYGKHKDGMKEGLGTLFNKAAGLATTVLDFGQKVITDYLPAGFKQVKDLLKSAKDEIFSQFNRARDLYLPGGTEPVIRAVKLRAGFYRDSVTGLAITSIDELMKCKNDIVDASGNVLLSIEERASGLYDLYGDKVKSTMTTVLHGAIGAAFAVKDSVLAGFKGLKDNGIKSFGQFKNYAKGKMTGFDGINVGNKYAKESNDTLIDIRDILLGDSKKVRERLNKVKLASDMAAAVLDSAPAGDAKTEGDKGRPDPNQFVGPMPAQAPSTGGVITAGAKLAGDAFGAAKDKVGSWKDRFFGKKNGANSPSDFIGPMQPPPSAGEFVGPVPLSASDRAKRKLSSWKDYLFSKTEKVDQPTPTAPVTQKVKALSELDKRKATIAGDKLANSRFKDHNKGWVDELNKHEKEGDGEWITDVDRKRKADIEASQIGPDAKHRKYQHVQAATQSTFNNRKPGRAMPAPAPKLPGKLGIVGKGLGMLRGAGNMLATGVGAAASAAGSLLGGSKANVDPNASSEVKEGEETEVRIKDNKGKVAAKDRAWNDKDGSGTRDGGVEERQEKQEALKASRNKQGAVADTALRYKSSENVIDTITKKMTGLFDMLTSGASGVFDFASGVLTKLPGLSKLAGMASSAVSTVGGFASSILSSGVTAGAIGAVKTAAIFAGQAALTAGSTLLSVAGSAVSAIAGAVSLPVVLGVLAVAAAGYGIWKLYKYANRDNATELDRIRLRQYGSGDKTSMDRFNHHFYTLEAYLQDGRISYTRGKASLLDRKVEAKDIAEIFNVDPEDKEHGAAVATWFSDRFKPFFLTHLTALYAVDDKMKLDETDKLKPAQKIKYLEACKFEGGPYNVDISPLKSIDSLNTDNQPVLDSIKALTAKYQAELDKDNKKVPIPLPPVKPDATKEVEKPPEKDNADKLRDQQKNEDQKQTEKNAEALETPVGEDGPKQDTKDPSTEGTSAKTAATPPPLAKGGPITGENGAQFLKMGNKVNLNNLHPLTLKHFMGMVEEYGKSTGKTVQVNDGFRSFAEQQALHAKYPQKAAKPGRSLHESGIAIDINSADADALDKAGLMRKYGFTRPVGGEPWHIEPAGVQKNIDLAKKDASERDKMVAVSLFRGGGGYGTQANATKYRRNHELAMNLLSAGSTSVAEAKPPAEKTDTAVAAVDASKTADTAGTSASGDKGTATAAVAATTPAADTATATTDDKSKTQSVKADLPSPQAQELKMSANEGETKPTEAGATDAASSSGGPQGDIKDTIAKNAKRAGVDPNVMLAMAAVESDMNPNAKAKGSSAAGAFQMLNATWKEQLGKHGSKYGLKSDASPFDVEASTLLASEYVKSNMKTISSVKPNPNTTDVYMTHFLGGGGARSFLGKNPEAIGASEFPKAAASNPGIFYKGGQALSIKDIYEGLTKKLQTKASRYGVQVTGGGMGLKPPAAGGSESGIGLGDGIAPSKSNAPIPSDTAGTSATPSATPPTSAPAPASTAGTSVTPPTPTPAVEPAPTPTGMTAANTLPNTKTAEDKGREMLPTSSSGVFVDKRGNSPFARERREAGEAMAGPSIASITTALDKSNGIQQESLDILKGILENVKTEKVAEMLSSALAAMMKGASASEGTTQKDQDNQNMQRSGKVQPPSLDMRRKSM